MSDPSSEGKRAPDPGKCLQRPKSAFFSVTSSSGIFSTATAASQVDEKAASESAEPNLIVGTIQFNLGSLLGRGADGTRVYRGSCGKRREVAVKRILRDNESLADIEVKHLIKLEEENNNVIRYYQQEQDSMFCYIAMELGIGTVEKYVEGSLELDSEALDKTSILRQASNGLRWLHSRNIAHRDIKPSNILLVKSRSSGSLTVKLADFGLSREQTESSLHKMTAGVGTKGWRAREVIEPRATEWTKHSAEAADVFSLGCVFYYVLSDGHHPFDRSEAQGDFSLEDNIMRGRYCLSAVKDLTQRVLVEEMIQRDAKKRPTAEYVNNHPLLWKAWWKMDFIGVIADLCMNKENRELLDSVDDLSFLALGEEEDDVLDWRDTVMLELQQGLAKYDGKTLSGLVRLIRNKLHHLSEVPREALEAIGNSAEGLVTHMERQFPNMLLCVWLGAHDMRLQSRLEKFYKSFRLSDVNTFVLAGFNLDKTELMPTKYMKTVKRPKRAGLVHLRTLAGTCELEDADLRNLQYDRECLLRLITNNSSSLESLVLPAGVGVWELAQLLQKLHSLQRLSVVEADCSAPAMAALPKSLRRLNIRGAEVRQPQWTLAWYGYGLHVTLQQVSGDLADLLTALSRPVEDLDMHECPVTEAGLEFLSKLPDLERLALCDCPILRSGSLELVSKLTKLRYITLSGGVSDGALDSLAGCPVLRWLTLGERHRTEETSYTAGAIRRLAEECRELEYVSIHCTADMGQAVVTALNTADLGWDDDAHRLRTIRLYVPHKIYQTLEKQACERVRVEEWDVSRSQQGIRMPVAEKCNRTFTKQQRTQRSHLSSPIAMDSPDISLEMDIREESRRESSRLEGTGGGRLHLLLGDTIAGRSGLAACDGADDVLSRTEDGATWRTVRRRLHADLSLWRTAAAASELDEGNVVVWLSGNDVYGGSGPPRKEESYLNGIVDVAEAVVTEIVRQMGRVDVYILGPLPRLSREEMGVTWESTAAYHLERALKKRHFGDTVAFIRLGRALTRKITHSRSGLCESCLEWFSKSRALISPEGYQKLSPLLPKWLKIGSEP